MTKLDHILDGASVLIVFVAMVLGLGWAIAVPSSAVLAMLWSVVSDAYITNFGPIFWTCYALAVVGILAAMVRDARAAKPVS